MNEYILKDIVSRLRNNFGIDTPLSNSSQRLQTIVSLLGIYDSNWCLESVPNLIGHHVEVDFEHQSLTKEQSNSIKRWLQRLDLGYLIIPKKIEEFCANKKKYYHMLSVLMDKVEQHLGTLKLKSNIRVIIQKQSRMKIQSNSLSLSKRNVSNHSSSSFDYSAIEEKSLEDVFHGIEIPRTPAKLFSTSSPNLEEDEKNKTFDLENELSIIPISFVKDFDDLPYDNSNKRSSHYRRSSFDKNVIPTGRQIPNTPINQRSSFASGDATFTLSDDLENSPSSLNECKEQVIHLLKNQVTSSKRRRSPSKDRITNYALDEPESGTVWDCESDTFISNCNSTVKNIDWESTFHSSERSEQVLDDQFSRELENNIKEVKNFSLNSLKIEKEEEETTKIKKPSRGRKKKVDLVEEATKVKKSSRGRRKKVDLVEDKVEDTQKDDQVLVTTQTNRTSRRRKCSVKSQDIISDKKEEINVEDLTSSLDTVSLDKCDGRKGLFKKITKVRKGEVQTIDTESTLNSMDLKNIDKLKKVDKTVSCKGKENSDPALEKSFNKNCSNISPQNISKNSSSSITEDINDKKEVTLRRSARNRKQNPKYTEDPVLESNNECLTDLLETKNKVSKRRNTKLSNAESMNSNDETLSTKSSQKKKSTSNKSSKKGVKVLKCKSSEGNLLEKTMEALNNDNIVPEKNATKRNLKK